MNIYVYFSALYSTQDLGNSQVSNNKWIDKEDGAYISMEYHDEIRHCHNLNGTGGGGSH